MLTRNVTETRDIPNEPGQRMTFRQLGWRQLTEAQEAKSATTLRNLKNMGGELLRDLQNMNRDQVDADATAQAAVDPLALYDQATILYYGLVSWTYPEKLDHGNIDALDGATAKWAAEQIVNLGRPVPEAEIEERFLASHNISTASSPVTATIATTALLGHQPNGSSA